MLDAKVVELLNQQVNKEFYSAWQGLICIIQQKASVSTEAFFLDIYVLQIIIEIDIKRKRSVFHVLPYESCRS